MGFYSTIQKIIFFGACIFSSHRARFFEFRWILRDLVYRIKRQICVKNKKQKERRVGKKERRERIKRKEDKENKKGRKKRIREGKKKRKN